MEHIFPEIKKQFGFGFMRLPMIEDQVDIPQTMKMVDLFLENGFNYFDTAHGYIDGKSEKALKTCLTSRYPRDRYILTDKLSAYHFKNREDIRPLLEEQLEACGVDYFDFYLMHAQNAQRFEQYEKVHAYDEVLALKAEGKIRHMGISFHDGPEVLDRILTARPEIEVVQLQFNYLDYEYGKVQSRRCYEVCRKHRKPVLVMEPVKGGALVNLPRQAQEILDELGGGSNAAYALRFAADFPGIRVVLSGMSTLEQAKENIELMKAAKPLSEKEQEAICRVRKILQRQREIPCTGCRYCTEVCPVGISIPELFALLNEKRCTGKADTAEIPGSAPKGCLGCGKCAESCPQKLDIPVILRTVREELNL